MPLKCAVSEQINAPTAKVFTAVSDIPALPQHFAGIKSIEVLSTGPVGKGTKYRETRIMFGKPAIATMEIIDFQPGRSYTTGAVEGGCEYKKTVRVSPAASGSEVTIEFAGTPLKLSAKLMAPLMSLMVKTVGAKALRKDLADLKASMEKPTTV